MAAVALAVVGLLVRVEELFPLAAAAAVLLAASTVWVRARTWDLVTDRRIVPHRVGAGSPATVDLALLNRGSRRSPVLQASDPCDGGRRVARFAVAPLEPGEIRRATYHLPTTRRGVLVLGPLEVRAHDPFGLVQAVRPGAAAATLSVHPRVEDLAASTWELGSGRLAPAGSPSRSAPGDEVYALREYRVGDDLRRVHWASSAHHDDLMIRQEEVPLAGRLAVLADLRAEVHSVASLETALSAVASLVEAGIRAGTQVRCVTSAGADSGWGAGAAHRGAIMDILAGAGAHAGEAGPWPGAGREPAVLVTTDASGPVDLAGDARAALSRIVLVQLGTGPAGVAGGDGEGGWAAAAGDGRVVRVPVGGPLGAAWAGARPAGRRGVRPRARS